MNMSFRADPTPTPPGATPSGSPTGGIDWNIHATLPDALSKFNFWQTIAGVLMWGAYVVGFLAALVAVITWLGGGTFIGRHVSEQAKQNLLRALALGLCVGSAGGVWSWMIAGP